MLRCCVGVRWPLIFGFLLAGCAINSELLDKPLLTFEELMRPGGVLLTYDPGAIDEPLLDVRNEVGSHTEGRRLFHRDWQKTYSLGRSPIAGPDFDRSSCSACHIETAPSASALDLPLIAKPVRAGDIALYGGQLTSRHHSGSPPEGVVQIEMHSTQVSYRDGSVKTLQRPVANALTNDGTLVPVALRAAPLLFGWGLIEGVDPEALSHHHDPGDRNGDGVSGVLVQIDGGIGRFGWKNQKSTLRSQIRAALLNDMGVVSAAGPANEINDVSVDALTDYVAHLGVPTRGSSRGATAGELHFGRAGCGTCHMPALQTLPSNDPFLSEQLIWPYTDLMLHDMGPELSDPIGGNLAAEWRTAPLWGVGVAEQRLVKRGFLHDGRARDIEEAILWHGGEGQSARDFFVGLGAAERAELLDFVLSL